MKKRILFICYTYYQLIVATQIRLTIFKDDFVDAIICDSLQNIEIIASNINQHRIFTHAYTCYNKKFDKKGSRLEKPLFVMSAVIGNPRLLKIREPIRNWNYDEFIYYNMTLSSVLLFDCIYKHNKRVVCNRFEEGIFSYRFLYMEEQELSEKSNGKIFNEKINLTLDVRQKTHRKNILEKTKGFYCFYPEHYKGRYKTIKIVTIDDSFKDICRKMFGISDDMCYIPQKYIYFSGMFDLEGGESINEAGVIQEIAKLVGKENLIVKKHPRDNRNIYEENKIHTLKASYLPWEAFQLSYEYSDKILLTAFSGALISVNLITKKPVRSYFLYNICSYQGNMMAKSVAQEIDNIFESPNLSEKLKYIKKISNLQEILQ